MLGEESFDGPACSRSEKGERARFGRDEDERNLASFPLELRRRQEREFVQRERPHDPGRDHENEALVLARLHFVEESSEPPHVRAAAKGQGSGDGDFRAGAAGEDDGVVANALPARQLGDVRFHVHSAQVPGRELGAGDASQVGELPAEDRRPAEGLGDSERPVEEVVLGGDEFDIDELTGELAQGEHGLEAGNASSADEDTEIATPHRGGPSHRSIVWRLDISYRAYCPTSSSPHGQA